MTVLLSCPPSAKYLGHVEVEESRGMHVCEDAVKKLKAVSEGWAARGQGRTGRGSPDPALSPPPQPQMGRKSVKSVLWVSADGLRVVDDKTKVGGPRGWGWAPSGPLSSPCLNRGLGHLPTHSHHVPPSRTF